MRLPNFDENTKIYAGTSGHYLAIMGLSKEAAADAAQTVLHLNADQVVAERPYLGGLNSPQNGRL